MRTHLPTFKPIFLRSCIRILSSIEIFLRPVDISYYETGTKISGISLENILTGRKQAH